MENTNINRPQKHIFTIPAMAFYDAWKMQFEKRLIMAFELHLDVHEREGLPILPFEEFCAVAYQVKPEAVETRDN